MALTVLDISGKRASEGQFLPKKEFVNNNSRKLQGASFRDFMCTYVYVYIYIYVYTRVECVSMYVCVYACVYVCK